MIHTLVIRYRGKKPPVRFPNLTPEALTDRIAALGPCDRWPADMLRYDVVEQEETP